MNKKYFDVRFVALLFAVVALGACSSQAAPPPSATTAPQAAPSPTVISTPTKESPRSEPVALRLAVSDSQGSSSEPLVLEFVEQVKTLSNGNITIEPIWDAADDSKAGFEGRVIQLVRDGKAELGLAASRAWDTEDITSFQALQAPFLIDNEALAEAVATSDIASRMLDNLPQSGFVGLTLWLEDMRHPFSLLPDKPILSPADFAGRTIRVTSSRASEKLIEALGGTAMYGGGGYDGAESGLRQARSLSGTPTATGNVTFFPKYQVLFANGASFEKLSDAQRAILHEAAAAVQKKAIAEHPSEVEAAQTWCSDAGAVVLASDEQIAAFEKAAQPVFDWIQQGPQNAELVAAIRELKAKTQPSQAVQACAYEVAQQNPTPDAAAQAWSSGLPPNGIWQVTLTNDDVIKMGVSKTKAPDWSGAFTFTFQDGNFHWTWEGTEGYAKGQTASADGSYEVVEDFVRLTSGDVVDDIRWQLDEEGLHFHLLATQNDPFTEIRAMLEANPYQRAENWSTGMIPNGVWQVTLTSDDVIKMGVSKAKAPEWSGVFTHTFKDGVFHTTWQGTEGDSKGQTGSCDGTYELVEGHVSVKLSADCGNEVDNIQWRLDDDGLHFHVVDIQNGSTIEVTAIFEAKPYQKVAEAP